MAFDDFRSDAFFLDKLGGRQKEVEKEAPFVVVEIVEGRDDLGILKTAIGKPLPDLSPVFLFDVSVVIFLVGPGASELDRILTVLKVTDEVPIEELGAIVAIEAEDREREAGFDILKLF